jgi:hypothetical protein
MYKINIYQTKQAGSSSNCFDLYFGICLVQILAETLTFPIDVFHGFPQSLWVIVMIVAWNRLWLLPHQSFQVDVIICLYVLIFGDFLQSKGCMWRSCLSISLSVCDLVSGPKTLHRFAYYLTQETYTESCWTNDFQLFWFIIKPSLCKTINRFFCMFHKLFHKFCWKPLWKTFTISCWVFPVFSYIDP